MNLVRWDPFSDMAHLRDQVNRLFEQSIGVNGREPLSTRTWAPLVDIEETKDALVVHVELPSVKPEEISIQVEGSTLTIRGERKFEKEENSKQFVRIERSYGAFQRSFNLGVPIKADEVSAQFCSGVLEVTLPKADEVRPKQIPVKVDPQIEAK